MPSIEPRALDELIPDWKDKGAPLNTPAGDDRFLFLTEKKSFKMPTPPQMHNHGNYIVSLGNVCRWLGEQAEAAGVEIYPGFAAAEVLYDENGAVKGVATGDMGLNKDRTPGPNHEPGVELYAKQTVFAEGCRGSLTKALFERYDLREGVQTADLRHRHQGTLGSGSCRAPAGAGGAHGGLAPGHRHIRWLVSLSHGRQSDRGGLRGRT